MKHFRHAELLFSRGYEFSGLYAVLKVSVQITAISDNSKEPVLIVLESPNWFGEIALFDNKERTHDAYTVDVHRTVVDSALTHKNNSFGTTGMVERIRLAAHLQTQACFHHS